MKKIKLIRNIINNSDWTVKGLLTTTEQEDIAVEILNKHTFTSTEVQDCVNDTSSENVYDIADEISHNLAIEYLSPHFPTQWNEKVKSPCLNIQENTLFKLILK